MKHIRKYNEFILIEKLVTNKVFYHGSPYVFENFKNSTVFFAETEDFAINYSEQKSMDFGMDREPNLYKVKFNGNILDINDPTDYNKLRNSLPEKVEYSYNNFGFTAEISKDEILMNMSGYYIKPPIENIYKIGDKIPDPSYQTDKYIVYKIDDNYIYTYFEREFDRIMNSMFPTESSYDFSMKSELKNIFNPINDYVKEYIKEKTKNNPIYINKNIIKLYSYVFLGSKSSYEIDPIPEKNIKDFNKLYEKAKSKVIDYLKGYQMKFNLKPEKILLDDTWRYFENETVHQSIVNLGYDGYVAKERKINTYAIFKPNETVKILNYKFPVGDFENWDDWKNYNKYDRFIGENIPREKLSFINRYDIYNFYKKKLPKEEALQIFSDRNKREY